MATQTDQRLQPADEAGAGKKGKGGGKKKKLLMMIAGVLVLVLGGGGYFFLGQSGGPPPAPKPGDVLKVDAIHINLAGGHYLKLAIALQAVQGAKVADGSKALDLAVDLFSNRDMTDLVANSARDRMKQTLVKQVNKAYDGQVMDVYFTEFVMQ